MSYLVPPRRPESLMELVDQLSPEQAEEDAPYQIFAKLSGSERQILADLASQIRAAETKADKDTAIDSMRYALEAYGFDAGWIKQIMGGRSKGTRSGRAVFAKMAGVTYPEPQPWNFGREDSRCRFYSTPEGEPDGNQGGFTE